MTLDEAIKHAEKVAIYKADLACTLWNSKEKVRCEECAKEHRQLAEWLKELKEIKQIIAQHDADSMPEDFWYIDKIREVVKE